MFLAVLLFGLPLVGIIAGAWQARRGMRGIAIDDHPCCDACGYDMVNAAASSPCPECGSPPGGPRRIGNRARQPRRIAFGLGLLGLCALVLGGALFRVASPGSFRSLVPLWAIRVEARTGSIPAIDELARRLRTGALSGGDMRVVVDEALAERHANYGIERRAAWGDVVDAGLSSGTLDQARSQRCLNEAVGVNWIGTSELFKDINGRSVVRGISFMFAPAVGPGSSIAFDADLESATVEGYPLRITPMENGVVYLHASTPAARDSLFEVELPARVAGKSLIVKWRIKIKDAATGAPLAKDWVHTETIAIPATGSGIFNGGRHREPDSDE